MIAIDTNILVYAHRQDADRHSKARECLTMLCNGQTPFAIPYHCLVEFFAIVTHPRVYRPPSSTEQAIDQLDAWLESPAMRVLTESSADSWQTLRAQLRSSNVAGPQVHDARIAALCIEHQVTELWSRDRDYSRFQIRTSNPLH